MEGGSTKSARLSADVITQAWVTPGANVLLVDASTAYATGKLVVLTGAWNAATSAVPEYTSTPLSHTTSPHDPEVTRVVATQGREVPS